MKDGAPKATLLADYTAFGWTIEKVELHFTLHPTKTRVRSRIAFAPNPAAPHQPFFLHGEQVTLISAQIDGADIKPQITDTGLTCPVPDGPFVWQAEVEISPSTNTALEGLYMSNGMYCTQCEAEGFRTITFYPDRPDVMAPFDVTIDSDLPVLLSNGNPAGGGVWHDPWPKPAYLFALVAGELLAVSDDFTTASGAKVALNIWVRPGDEDKCDYALDALKRSMRWDEQAYGREYDLDVFNIVAVDDFNMGAMENKGLNIFNSKYVLASPQTATDDDYARIEAIIAHEYFHNWTGNRITCRDWFQLCLKEGLTVFRDQQFSGDMRSHAVKRIEDVLMLRARQFREDNGPLAHPVRPQEYVEINNFYTATIYEKGAEVIGMLKLLVGDDGYKKALDLYFERHDGDASTIEDWLAVFQDATGRDLGQFALWYSQPGTPRLTFSDNFKGGIYTITLEQKNPKGGAAQTIPVAVGLLSQNGDEMCPTEVLEMTQARQSFTFENLPSRPVPSLLRGFSAPVILQRDMAPEDHAFLMTHDTDPFNKWEAGRALAKDVLVRMVTQGTAPSQLFLDGARAVVQDPTLDPAFRALALGLPSEDDMAQTLFDSGMTPDPLAIHAARRALRAAVAAHLGADIPGLRTDMRCDGLYSPAAQDAGKRALGNALLGLQTLLDDGQAARAQFAAADNMTDQLAAYSALLAAGMGAEETRAFYTQWSGDRLVMDKWFALQVGLAAPEVAVDTAKALTAHPDFNWKNPNRFRTVIGGLAMNAAGFHDPSGAGYDFIADWLVKLDGLNPQTAARMSTAFDTMSRYDADRQGMMRDALGRMAAHDGLSRDMTEMVGRMLKG